MQYIQRRKLELPKAIHILSSTIYHFENYDNLINNTYIITIHFRDRKNIDYKYVSDKLNIAINKAITGKDKPRDNKKIGLLINFDVEGTRDHRPVIKGYICPHFHGCIFLQDKTINNRSDNEVINAIKNEIYNGNSKLRAPIQKINIVKYDDLKGNLLRYISYMIKAERYEDITSQLNQTTFIYPFDNKRERANFIAPKLHINDKQAKRNINDIGNKIDNLSQLIAKSPIKVFGADHSRKILGEYNSFYMKYNNIKPQNNNILYNYISHLVKSGAPYMN